MVLAFLTSEVKLASTKNLTTRIIDFVHQNKLTSKMTIGIDIADANNKEFGLKIVTEKQFTLARQNHFKFLPQKQFYKWDFGINNYSNTVINNVYPNVALKHKQLMLCIGGTKANGYSSFKLQFDRLYWLNTIHLTGFLGKLKAFLEKENETFAFNNKVKSLANPRNRLLENFEYQNGDLTTK